MVQLSVIIPTYNRADYLVDTLTSLFSQTLDKALYEIIVVDNGSTDNTQKVIREINYKNDNRLRYFYEETPGLHTGRHLGAKEARSALLVYTDDDIIAAPGWLEAIKNTFDDPSVALVGGRILPKWEGDVPDWMNLFKSEGEYGWTIGYLSILDFGDITKEIPADYVYGCNFSIRKPVLYECGGFHPDAMPQELIRYRGDGESALSFAIMAKGYKSIYEPQAFIYHRVPPERLTVDYFCRRAFNQGVSDSYTQIRKYGGLNTHEELNRPGISLLQKLKDLLRPHLFWRKDNQVKRLHPILKKIQHSYKEGKRYHLEQVKSDSHLLAHVLKEVYY